MRSLAPFVVAPAPTDWRAAALEAHTRAEHTAAVALQADLATRVAALTGVMLSPEQMIVEQAARQAIAHVDGVQFRLREGTLNVVRPCAACGTGACASRTIRSQADLGYTLAAWEPRCLDCGPDDNEDWSFSW